MIHKEGIKQIVPVIAVLSKSPCLLEENLAVLIPHWDDIEFIPPPRKEDTTEFTPKINKSEASSLKSLRTNVYESSNCISIRANAFITPQISGLIKCLERSNKNGKTHQEHRIRIAMESEPLVTIDTFMIYFDPTGRINVNQGEEPAKIWSVKDLRLLEL